MANKKRFKEMIIELRKIYDNQECKNHLVRLFPVRDNVSDLKHSIREILEYIKINMISIITGYKKIDIYQEYFEDYDINDGILTINFKYNKQKKIKLIF